MNKVIVSLVGEQTAPNIFLIKNSLDASKFIFLTTKKTNIITENICNVFKIPENKIKSIIVNQDDAGDIRKKLNGARFDFDNNEYIVNITGGNKLMSFVTYNYFVNNNCKICYLPIGFTKFQCLHPQYGNAPDTPKMLTFDEYIKSYGVETKFNDPFKKTAFNLDFKNNIFYIHREIIRKLVELQNCKKFKNKYRDKNEKIISDDEFNAYHSVFDINELIKLRQDCKSEHFTYKLVKHITGGWFEEYVYQSLKKAAQKLIHENDVKLNVSISKNGVDNELDVMFMYKNQIHIIECKTGIDDSFIKDTLYKQKAISSGFGLNPNMYLFSMDKVKENDIRRAKSFGIKVVDIDKLNFSGDNFLDNFGNLFKD
jgi:hypothetical protein